MTRIASLVTALALVIGPTLLPASTTASAQGRQTFVGTWLYNAGKSTPTANTYKYRRIVVSQAGTGLTFSIEEALADGPEMRWGFTTKGDGKGIGLGLSVSRDILRAAGGDLELHSVPARGTTAVVTLPAAVPAGLPTREARAAIGATA